MSTIRKIALACLLQAACAESSAGTTESEREPPYEPPAFMLPDADASKPAYLSSLGLYDDPSTKRVASDLLAFEPAYPLWSDGAEKHRWLRLPPGQTIDTSDMDHWQFPVGTVLFKEFSLHGKRLETRVLARTGPSPSDTWMGAFAWNDSETDAVLVRDGQENVRGTDHDIPSQKTCFTCHNGEPGRVLGFSAVQQPSADRALLSHPPDAPYRIPGSQVAVAALGYLHANCGHCHSQDGSARPDTDMLLRLSTRDTTPLATTIERSTLGVRLQYFASAPLALRVSPGRPDESGLLFRMMERGPKTQMPPLATEHVDTEGTLAVRAWIESSPPRP